MTMLFTQTVKLPCGVSLHNRLSKAAMTEGLATAEGIPTAELTRLYGLWSDGGAGMLLSGNIMIDKHHLERPGNVIIDRSPSPKMHDALGNRRNPKWQSILGTNKSCWSTDSKNGE